MDDDLTASLGQDRVRVRLLRGKAIRWAAAFAGVGLAAAMTFSGVERIKPPPSAASKSADFSRPPGSGFQISVPDTGADKGFALSGLKEANRANRPLQAPDAGAPAGQATVEAGAIEMEGGVKIVRAGGEGAPGPLVIDVAKALYADAAATADPRLLEPSRYGPLPRIGIDGSRPSKVYARPASSSAGGPRIALVVCGLGRVARVTETAISTLPGEVTLGFTPYGSDLSRQTAFAREAGHEVVLQIPMEPFDYSRINPGPHGLLAGAGKAANLDNLTWLMSRFTGYAGVMSFLGGRFTADERALDPVLREIAARGLFYLDDGSSSLTIAVKLAADQGFAARQADIILDSTEQPEAVDAALARLEAIARDKGTAIGVASALPASIAAIGRLARVLESHGISLIPLSATMPDQPGGVAVSSTMR